MVSIHVFSWGIPLVLSLLPLSTNSYGTDDFASGNLTCDLWGNVTTKFIWLDICATGAAMLCFVLMANWSVEIYFHFHNAEDSVREMSFLDIMKLYPLALLVTWLPRCFMAVLVSATVLPVNSSSVYVASFFFIVSTQYGTLTALIYFSNSTASRLLWMNLLRFQFFGTFSRKTSEITFSDECSDAANSMEDVLVNRAMIGEENRTLTESFSSFTTRDSLPLSMRESATTNVMIQLAIQ